MIRKYDEDEIMILSGQFADHFQNEHRLTDEKRNLVADRVERIMAEYTGPNRVPLPGDLVDEMEREALAAIGTAPVAA